MNKEHSLRSVETHFDFGGNWSEYAKTIDEPKIEEAVKGVTRLVGEEAVAGRTFLDIGSGSGIHSLAALRMGCSRLLAIDLDKKSVKTTTELLGARAQGGPWECREMSVFDLNPATMGSYDVVYSWGVLHQTGAMWEAIGKAADMVAPGGMLAIALYRRTPLCWLWVYEKRFYSRAPRFVQAMIRTVYVAMFRVACRIQGFNFKESVRTYKSFRGMDYYHDVHDWLGGYPHESTLPPEVEEFVGKRGFTPVRSFTERPTSGYFGTGCDEFVFRKT